VRPTGGILKRRPRCAYCGSTRNLQRHHVGTSGRTIWICEKCHNREHRRFHVVSPNRAAFKREARTLGLDLEELRRKYSIYGPIGSPKAQKSPY